MQSPQLIRSGVSTRRLGLGYYSYTIAPSLEERLLSGSGDSHFFCIVGGPRPRLFSSWVASCQGAAPNLIIDICVLNLLRARQRPRHPLPIAGHF